MSDSSSWTLPLPDLPLLPQALFSFRTFTLLDSLSLGSIFPVVFQRNVFGRITDPWERKHGLYFFGTYFHILQTELCTFKFCVKYTSAVCLLHLGPVSLGVKLHTFLLIHFFPFGVMRRTYGHYTYGLSIKH